MLKIARTILTLILAVGCLMPVAGQEYTITKLKLFPDRDEVFVKDVTVDSLGFIWFLTNGEIYRYDGYRSLDILNTIADQRLTDDMPQRMLMDGQNRLWMAGNANLSYLDLKAWQVHAVDATLLPPVHDRMVRWMKLLADGTVVVAYENGYLLLIKGDEYMRFDELYEEGLSVNAKVVPLSATRWNGRYWIGTSAGTLLSIDSLQGGYRTEYHEFQVDIQSILNLVADDEGLIINAFPDTLYRLGQNGGLAPFNPADFSIAENDYYVLGEGNGMHVYADTKKAYILDTDFGIRQEVAMPLKNRFGPKHVCFSGDEIILGAEEGVFVLYPKTKGLSQYIPANESTNKSTRGIYVYPDGAFFYCTYQGGGFVEADGTDFPFEQLRHGYVLYPINDNELLVGTEGGFLKIFDRRRRLITDIDYSLSVEDAGNRMISLPVHVMSISETGTDYLIGSSEGLWLLDKQTHLLRRFTDPSDEPHRLEVQIRFIQPTAVQTQLLSTSVGLFEVSDGAVVKRYPEFGNLGIFKTITVGDTLWVATQGKGLVALDAQGRVLQAITTEDGLSNNLVYSLEYVEGMLVAGTADGLNLIRNGKIRRIGTAEGLSQSEFNSGASFWDGPRKRLFIGGLMGYTVLDATQEWFDDDRQLESYVTEVHISAGNSGEKSADYTRPYVGEQALVLQPDESLTGLYVGTPGSYRADSEIRYALNDGHWEPLALGQFISLIEPSPADYRFRLETLSTGIRGKEKELIITKLPHFYETWWFNVVVLLAVSGAIGGFFKYRENIQRKEKKMRIKIASDLHDEVGSSLTRIYFQADLLSAKHQGLPDDKALQQIADTSKEALLTMSDMVWSIDSRFDTVKDLVIRMKDYLYKLRDELDITYRFDVQGDHSARAVSQLVRQNLFLIFKEAVTNAVKYGGGSEITINLDFGRVIKLTVRNRYEDRSGAVAGLQGGRGLDSMRQRAERVGGELTYTGRDGVFVVELLVG